jgi:hypothetical protein
LGSEIFWSNLLFEIDEHFVCRITVMSMLEMPAMYAVLDDGGHLVKGLFFAKI